MREISSCSHDINISICDAQLTFVIKDDSDDETIDTQDTRHDNRYDGLEDEVGLEDTHGADTNT